MIDLIAAAAGWLIAEGLKGLVGEGAKGIAGGRTDAALCTLWKKAYARFRGPGDGADAHELERTLRRAYLYATQRVVSVRKTQLSANPGRKQQIPFVRSRPPEVRAEKAWLDALMEQLTSLLAEADRKTAAPPTIAAEGQVALLFQPQGVAVEERSAELRRLMQQEVVREFAGDRTDLPERAAFVAMIIGGWDEGGAKAAPVRRVYWFDYFCAYFLDAYRTDTRVSRLVDGVLLANLAVDGRTFPPEAFLAALREAGEPLLEQLYAELERMTTRLAGVEALQLGALAGQQALLAGQAGLAGRVDLSRNLILAGQDELLEEQRGLRARLDAALEGLSALLSMGLLPRAGQLEAALHASGSPVATAELLRQVQLLLAAQGERGVLRSPEEEAADQELLDRYLEWLVETYAELDLPGLPTSRRRMTVPLDTVFVALRGDTGGSHEMVQNRMALEQRARELGEFTGLGEPTRAQFDQVVLKLAAQGLGELAPETVQVREHSSVRGQAAPQLVPLSEAFRQERRLVILGDPGSGKTTLGRWLTLRLARARLNGEDTVRVLRGQVEPGVADDGEAVDLGPARVPVFLRVAKFAQARAAHPGRRLSEFLGHHLGEHYGEPAANARGEALDPHRLNTLLRRLVAEGRAVVILDGLDEINDADLRHDVAGEVDAFINAVLPPARSRGGSESDAPWRMGGNQVVVTSRIVGYQLAPLRTQAAVLTIERMSEVALGQFCDVWIEALHRAAAPADHWDAAAQRAAHADAAGFRRAIADLQERGGGDLATNPLLVTILALVYRDGTRRQGQAGLPSERVRLYESAIEVLVRQWQERAPAGGDRLFGRKEVLEAMVAVAEHIHTHSSVGVIDEKTLTHLLGRFLSADETEAFTATIREQVGLLAARGEGVYGFLHLTFQEYLAARALVADPDRMPERVLDRLHSPRWQEPLRMALGLVDSMLDERGFTALCWALLKADDPFAAVAPRAEALLVAALPDVSRLPEQVLEEVLRRLLRRYSEPTTQEQLPQLRAGIERLARALAESSQGDSVAAFLAGVLRAHAASPTAEGHAAARLVRAARCTGPAVADALARALPRDEAGWGWAADEALRELASRHPTHVAGERRGLRATLLREPELAERLTGDAGYLRVALALYGGLDYALAEKISRTLEEEAQVQALLQGLTLTSPEYHARQAELAAREAALSREARELRGQGSRFRVEHMYRESAAVTPPFLAALRAGESSAALAIALRAELVGTPGDDRHRFDLSLALLALGAADASVAARMAETAPSLRGELRRVLEALRPAVPALSDPFVKRLASAEHTPSATAVVRLVRGLVSLSATLGVNPPGELLEVSRRIGSAPYESASVLGEYLCRALAAPDDDPVYGTAVMLDVSGKAMGEDLSRLAFALAMAPHCAMLRIPSDRVWLGYDPLSPLPTNLTDALLGALDAVVAIPPMFDFVREWILSRLAPSLAGAGLGLEAFVVALTAVAGVFDTRRDVLAALLAADPALEALLTRKRRRRTLLDAAARLEDPYLRVRVQLRLVEAFPTLRARLDDEGSPLAAAALERSIQAVDAPARRVEAYLRLARFAAPERRTTLWGAALASAWAIVAPDLRAWHLAHLAVCASDLPAARLFREAVETAGEVEDAWMRAELLSRMAEALRAGAVPGDEAREAVEREVNRLEETAAAYDDPAAAALLRAVLHGSAAPLFNPPSAAGLADPPGLAALVLALQLLDHAAPFVGKGVAGGRVSDGEPEWPPLGGAAALLVEEGRRGWARVTLPAAVEVTRRLEAGEAGDAAAILAYADEPAPEALPLVRGWLAAGDARIRNLAGLLLAQAGEFTGPVLEHVLACLQAEHDRTRQRAALLLRNPYADLPPRFSVGRVGIETVERAHAQSIRHLERDEPSEATAVFWFACNLLHDDEGALERWAEALRDAPLARSTYESPPYQALSNISWLDPRLQGAVIRTLETGGPAAQRALVESVTLQLYRLRMDAGFWGKLAPALHGLASGPLADWTQPVRAYELVVSVLRHVVEKHEPSAAPATLSKAADLLVEEGKARMGDILRLPQNELRSALYDVGQLRFSNYAAVSAEARAAAAPLISDPRLFEVLVDWIHGHAERGVAVSSAVGGIGVMEELFCLAAAAAERMPSTFWNHTARLLLLRRHLADAACYASNFAVRQAAFVLLSLLRRVDPEVVDALKSGIRDVGSVQEAVFQTLPRYRECDPGVLEELAAELGDARPLVAYTALQLLTAIGENPRLGADVRGRIAGVIQERSHQVGSRDVFVQRRIDTYTGEVWSLVYVGPLNVLCHDALFRLAGGMP